MFDDCIRVERNDSGIYMIATLCLLVAVIFTMAVIHFACAPSVNNRQKMMREEQKLLMNPDVDYLDYMPKSTQPLDNKLIKQTYKENGMRNDIKANHFEDSRNYNAVVAPGNKTLRQDSKSIRNVKFDFDSPSRHHGSRNNMDGPPFYYSKNSLNDFYDPYSQSGKSILKRCSSSQELYQQKRNSLSLFNSMPDMHRNIGSLNNIPKSLTNQCRQQRSRSTSSITKYASRLYPRSDSIIEMDEDIDEGQIQCILNFDRERVLLTLSSLYIQTMLPAGIQGFVIEVTLFPNKHEVSRSKVYRARDGEINTNIDEVFQLQCNVDDINRCSLVISLKPVLGNVVLFAETELNQLELMRKSRVFLAGFLKGVITRSN